jgi:hypothetical protein
MFHDDFLFFFFLNFKVNFSVISAMLPHTLYDSLLQVSGLRLTPRITQLRQEEHADVSNLRELAHEREVHHAMQISQSWEDLSLMNESHSDSKSNKMGPLHVNLPPYSGLNCNSPSPTRLSSPGFQSPTRASRTFIRRSASPVLRPSPLGVKRKLDDEKNDYYVNHHLVGYFIQP